MTPERLEQLRDASRSGLYLTTAEALELCDEVDRLRAGVKAARDALAASSCMGGNCAGPGCYGCRDSTLAGNLGDLLNPTRGD